MQQSVIQTNDRIVINGVEVPPCPSDCEDRKFSTHSCTIINGTVYKDGYEWDGVKWKRTLMAQWYKYF